MQKATKRISTHAPHARRDSQRKEKEMIFNNFYSRASCEARHHWTKREKTKLDFYSRASCEARLFLNSCQSSQLISNFYSRASCEARLNDVPDSMERIKFLLTRLMRGATSFSGYFCCFIYYFYSRASCEARPLHLVCMTAAAAINRQEADIF